MSSGKPCPEAHTRVAREDDARCEHPPRARHDRVGGATPRVRVRVRVLPRARAGVQERARRTLRGARGWRVAGAPVRLCALLEASDVIDMMYVIQEMRTERNWNFTTEPSSQILLHPPTDKHSVADQIKQLGCPRLQSTVHSL